MELPRLYPVHVGLAAVVGGAVVLFSLIFFGFKAGEISTVTEQIAIVQSQNNLSMIILAGITTENDPQVRVKMIKSACPEIPTKNPGSSFEPILTPAESMCKTLLEIYGQKAKDEKAAPQPTTEETQ